MLVFIGDYIDRGENPWDTYRCIRALCEQGVALAILGNHDTNALAFSTRSSDGRFDPTAAWDDARGVLDRRAPAATGWIRTHDRRSNIDQHQSTLRSLDRAQYAEVLHWFRRLPVWIDLPIARFVHAAWVRPAVDRLASFAANRVGAAVGLSAPTLPRACEDFRRRLSGASPCLADDAWFALLDIGTSIDACRFPPDASPAIAFERILKGVEIELPDTGFTLEDAHRQQRRFMRAKWYEPAAGRSFDEHLLGTVERRREMRDALRGSVIPRPDAPLYPYDPADAYGEDEPPVFFGHYGLKRPDAEALLRRNCVCVDHSGFDAQGLLSAYRFDVGSPIEPAGFVSVKPVDPAPRH